jgi:hypothetical protein
MSISDILAIQNLMPGSEPELLFVKPGAQPAPFRFRDEADKVSALAELNALVIKLREEYGDDQATIDEEFHDIVGTDERLRLAALHFFFDEFERDPRAVKKFYAKRAKEAKRAGAKR